MFCCVVVTNDRELASQITSGAFHRLDTAIGDGNLENFRLIHHAARRDNKTEKENRVGGTKTFMNDDEANLQFLLLIDVHAVIMNRAS
jgi:hypothetical protein